MSQIYNLEPPTKGSLILETTHGPLQINLWSTESPLTTKNFLQHCLNGYYSNLPFHRIIPDVLVQTGDATKTGHGGVSATGDVPKETHGRLRFRRRGIVAMVVDSGFAKSQFFITLGAAEWLNGEHSIFGEVVGGGVYNLLSIGENAVDGFDVEGCPRVLCTRIVENPFEGMVPRIVVVDGGRDGGVVNAKVAVRRRELLSFVDSEDEDEDVDVRKVHKKRSRFGDVEKRVEGDHENGEERGDDKGVEADDEIIKRKNEEFALLKAQLENMDKELQGRKQVDVGLRKRTRTRRGDEGVLKRLKDFESRVRKSRTEARKDEHGRVSGAWFERGLRLATRAMEEEEYEVYFGNSRRR